MIFLSHSRRITGRYSYFETAHESLHQRPNVVKIYDHFCARLIHLTPSQPFPLISTLILFIWIHGNETSSFMKCKEFLDYLNDYQLPKKDSSPWSSLVSSSVSLLGWLVRYHLQRCLPSGVFFLQVFRQIFCMYFSSPLCLLICVNNEINKQTRNIRLCIAREWCSRCSVLCF